MLTGSELVTALRIVVGCASNQTPTDVHLLEAQISTCPPLDFPFDTTYANPLFFSQG